MINWVTILAMTSCAVWPRQCRQFGRRIAFAVRLGGEEFALLVPLSRAAECPPELVLDAVRGCDMPLGWRVTVSLGHADGRVDSDAAWRRLYRLADSALRAKSDGRDRACRATDFAEIAAA